eukprot:10508386-Alexandrium_andersonii.AAC.1
MLAGMILNKLDRVVRDNPRTAAWVVGWGIEQRFVDMLGYQVEQWAHVAEEPPQVGGCEARAATPVVLAELDSPGAQP